MNCHTAAMKNDIKPNERKTKQI